MANWDAETNTLGSRREPPPAARVPGLILLLDGTRLQHTVVPVLQSVIVGRARDCGLAIEDNAASRYHAEILRSPRGPCVVDRGSTNGTFVNGRPLPGGPQPLSAGDLVRVGQSIVMFVDDAARHVAVERAGLVGGWWARTAWAFVERFAASRLPVLLCGETGTGKEVVAGAVHQASRRTGPFVAVNCAALPEGLIESQLFGHRRGAFSGATEHSEGFFRAAEGGTLFLDEIGELPLAAQAKLLRALETGEIVPVGSTSPVRLDVRVIAATVKELKLEAERGSFRPDLYHRLAGALLVLAPLRERPEELAPLARHLLAQAGHPPCVMAEALEALLGRPWTGNVRELRQTLQAAAINAHARGSTAIDLCDLPELDPPEAIGSSPAPPIEAVMDAMRACGGNVSHAARRLNAHRAQIYRVLRAHGVRPDGFRGPQR